MGYLRWNIVMLTLCHAGCCSGAGGPARIASCYFRLLSHGRPEWSWLKPRRHHEAHALTLAVQAVLVLVLVQARGPSRR